MSTSTTASERPTRTTRTSTKTTSTKGAVVTSRERESPGGKKEESEPRHEMMMRWQVQGIGIAQVY